MIAFFSFLLLFFLIVGYFNKTYPLVIILTMLQGETGLALWLTLGFVPYLLWLGPVSAEILKLKRSWCSALMIASSAVKMYLVALGIERLLHLANS